MPTSCEGLRASPETGSIEAGWVSSVLPQLELSGYPLCMYSYENDARNRNAAARPPFQSVRLLGQLRERLRYLHYSLRTEQSYVYWAKFFVRFHGLKHPRDLGQAEVEAFLTMLAAERHVSVSTHRQALSALLFLYKEVLASELPRLQEIGRPERKRRIPAVLSPLECQRLLSMMEG